MATMRAAKTIWDACNGEVTNLAMQKLLYLAHMLELGAGRGPLASKPFEAWDYGPVEPNLYHRLKAYGSSPVADVFNADPYAENDPEWGSIQDVVQQLGGAGPGRLVAITHWEDGAWSNHYSPGMRGIIIPDCDILDEYNRRVRRSEDRAAAAG